MNLLEAFDLDRDGYELMSLVGAGGKTITMFALARALKKIHKRVLVTTTTSIFYPTQEACDRVIVSDAVNAGIFSSIPQGSVTVLGKAVTGERKVRGVEKEFVEELHEERTFDCILVECDGAKGKPIKAPARYEPVVPHNTTKTIGVIGLDSIGNPIDERHVHRAEHFCSAVGRRRGEILDPGAVVKLIVSPRGLFKGAPEKSTNVVLLNKADSDALRGYAAAIIKGLSGTPHVCLDRCITGTLSTETIHGYTLLR